MMGGGVGLLAILGALACPLLMCGAMMLPVVPAVRRFINRQRVVHGQRIVEGTAREVGSVSDGEPEAGRPPRTLAGLLAPGEQSTAETGAK